MTSSNDLDRRLGAWLDEGPAHAPDRAIESALAHARTHPRRRDPLAVLRRDPMAGTGFAGALRPLPLVAALGLILVAAIGVATVGGFLGRPSVVPPPLGPTSSPTAPSPTATPSGPPVPASSPAVVRVDLIDDIGGDAFVEITDQSGTMVDARSGQQAEAGEIAGDIGVANLAGDPTAIVLTWGGSPCDTGHVLTIAPDGRTMTMSRAACQGDSLGMTRVLVVRFDGAVPASEVVADAGDKRRLTRPVRRARVSLGPGSLPALERREEVDDRGRQALGLLHPHHVRDVVPDDCARVRGGRLQPLRRVDDIGEVEPAGDGQDGAPQVRQAVVCGWVEPDLAAAHAPFLVERPGHHPEHLAERPVDPIGRLARAVEPDLRLEVGQRVGIERLRRIDPVVRFEDRDLLGCGFDLEPAQAPGDADHGDDAVGVLDGRVERGPPAARVADQRGTPDPERVEDRDHVGLQRELDVLGGRGAVPAGVEANDAVSRAAEWRDHRVPGPQVGDPGVQEHDRRALSLVHDEEASARDIDV